MGDEKQNNFKKQQEHLKAMKSSSKVTTADSMIEDLLSKKETFLKVKDTPMSSASISEVSSPWLMADGRWSAPKLYETIWNLVKAPGRTAILQNGHSVELADTSMLSSLLMTSGLPIEALGNIWNLVNNTVPGALTNQELYSVLGLVALAQNGYSFNSAAVLNQIRQPPIPRLDLSILTQNTPLPVYSSVSSATSFSMTSMLQTDNAPGRIPSSHSSSNNDNDEDEFTPYVSAVGTMSKSNSNNSIMALDVNNLQSAPVLTIPTNFNSDTTSVNRAVPKMNPGGDSSFHFLPSTNSGLSSMSNMNLPKVQNNSVASQNVMDQLNKIPSISSSIVSAKNVNLNHTSEFSDSINAPLNNFQKSSSSNILSTLSKDLDLDDFNKTGMLNSNNVCKTNDLDDSSNLDDIFDSLSSERMASSMIASDNYTNLAMPVVSTNSKLTEENVTSLNSLNQTNPRESSISNVSKESAVELNSSKISVKPTNDNVVDSKAYQIKPNYDIDLFDMSIEPIFPDMKNSSNTVNTTKDNYDSFTMHNPLYQPDNDINETCSVKSNILSHPTILKTVNTFDEDDFTDFQSADFNEFNSVVFNKNESDFKLNKSFKSSENNENIDPFSGVDESSFRVNNIISKDNVSINDLQSLPQSFCGKKSSPNSYDDEFNSFQIASCNDVVSNEFVNSIEDASLKNENLLATLKFDSVSVSSNDNIGHNNLNETCDNTSLDLKFDQLKLVDDFKSQPSVEENIIFTSNKTDSTWQNISTDNVFNSSIENQSGLVNEDKYAALRMLEISSGFNNDSENIDKQDVNVYDEFGDFIAADQIQPTTVHLSEESCSDSFYDEYASLRVKCLEICLDILRKSYEILSSASSSDVLNQVFSNKKGSEHLTCLIEVHKMSERFMQSVDDKALIEETKAVWSKIDALVKDIGWNQPTDEVVVVGPACLLCNCNYGPSPIKDGFNTFHAQCVNLYLNYIDAGGVAGRFNC